MTPRVSAKVQREMTDLGTNPQILDLARRVHPTWVSAHGHEKDLGVEGLAREIGQCIAAINYGIEQGENPFMRYVSGPGIVVTCSGLVPGRYQVCVVAGEVFRDRITLE